MPDLLASLVLNDQDFQAKLSTVESNTSRSFGRLGSIIKSQTDGYEKFAKSVEGGFSLIGKVGGVVASIGAAVAGAFTAGQAIREFFTHEKADAEAAEKAITAHNDALKAISAIGSEFLDKQSAIDKAIQEAATAASKARQERFELDAKELERAGEGGLSNTEKKRRRDLQQEEEAAQSRLKRLQDERARLRQKEADDAAHSKQSEEGKRQVEQSRFDERARKEKQAFQEEQEKEAKRQKDLAYRNELEGQDLEVQLLRAKGKEKEAETLERQLALKKQLHDLDEQEGLSDAQRQSRKDQLLEIDRLQSQPKAEATSSRFATLGIGLVGDASTFSRALSGGGTDALRQKEVTLREQNNKVLELTNNLLSELNATFKTKHGVQFA